MSITLFPRTCIASAKALSSAVNSLMELDVENGVWSDEQVVFGGGKRPVWKYSLTTFAVQREGDDQDVCYLDGLVSVAGRIRGIYLHLLNLVARPLNQESSLPFLLHCCLC